MECQTGSAGFPIDFFGQRIRPDIAGYLQVDVVQRRFFQIPRKAGGNLPLTKLIHKMVAAIDGSPHLIRFNISIDLHLDVSYQGAMDIKPVRIRWELCK